MGDVRFRREIDEFRLREKLQIAKIMLPLQGERCCCGIFPPRALRLCRNLIHNRPVFQALAQKIPDSIFARLLPVFFSSMPAQIIKFFIHTTKSPLLFN
jgi:hypothetical protein